MKDLQLNKLLKVWCRVVEKKWDLLFISWKKDTLSLRCSRKGAVRKKYEIKLEG